MDLFGKTAADLQDGIVIGNDAITGTLKYVTDYTGFSSDVSLQSGHYIALHFTKNVADAIVKVEIVGGTSGAVTLDSDMTWVGYIANTSQSIKVTANADGYDEVTKTYSLSGLTLE